MNSIFYFLCGCLYVIGLVFGLSYKEISVYICIYACPIICVLCALASVLKGNIRTFFGRVRFSVNTALLILYMSLTGTFWSHYGEVMDPFQLCVDDITRIANNMHITYEECNIYIYCYLFFSIILFHLLQIFIFKNKRDSRKAVSAFSYNKGIVG